MSKATTLMARRIVSKLLGEDQYASQDDYDSRPGGPKDPYRQATVKLAFKKKDFTGKRGVKPVAAEPKGKRIGDGGEFMKKRFNISFAEGATSWAKRKLDLAKEILQPGQSKHYRLFRAKELIGVEPDPAVARRKKAGAAVASKPGKVSYREALMQHVLEKLKMKKAGKGAVVAKKPGKVKYCKEQFQDFTPPVRGDWDAFWEQVRVEALEAMSAPDDPESKEFLETVRYYVYLSDSPAYLGFDSALQDPRAWANINPAQLRKQWEQDQAKAQEDANGDAPDAPEPSEPSRAAPPGTPEPGHGAFGESKSRAKRLLKAVAKAPGPVRYGKK
jgi:hypothetical protein